MHQDDHQPIYDGSVELSTKLMLATVLSVPIMLFPKPFILLAQHNKKQAQKGHLVARCRVARR